MSLRDDIIKLDDCPLTPVDLGEWGVMVYFRRMNLLEIDSLNSLPKKDGEVDPALLAVSVILDADGNRVFTDDDADMLRKKSVKALSELVAKFSEVNGLSDDSIESAGNE